MISQWFLISIASGVVTRIGAYATAAAAIADQIQRQISSPANNFVILAGTQ
jgi:hypothetical protein